MLQYYSDLKINQRPDTTPAIIPAQAIKIVDLGLNSAASSLMWIYAVQEVNDYPEKFGDMVKVVNDLDPKFSYPYAFSTIILPNIGHVSQGVEIAELGIQDADPDWRIPYYLATTYHEFFKDRINAIKYFNLAANTPGASEIAKTAAARYGTSNNYREQTRIIWESIYATSNDELVKDNAKTHLVQLDILDLLDKAVSLYVQKYGTVPKDINDLITKGILVAIPPSPFGVQFYLDWQGHVLIR